MKELKQLKKYFASGAKHHAEMAALHKAAMDECSEDEDERGERFHKGALASHLEHAESCQECAKSAQDLMTRKAAGLADGDELVPLPVGIRGFAPTAPTAIPRFGAPAIQKTAVAPEFRKLVAVSDDDEE